MGNYSKSLISFSFRVDETVRYQCRSEDYNLISDKEIFRIGSSYFFYMFNRNGKNSTYSLRDISKEEYYERKNEFFRLRPNDKFGKFKRGDNEYFIACFRGITWEKNMPMLDVAFEANTLPKQIYDEYKEKLKREALAEKENEQYSRRIYARICGSLSSRLGVSYVNVLRIGTNEDELLAFQESYMEAIKKIESLSMPALRYFYNELFKNSRSRRRAALDMLGVKYFNADVLILDLKELEAAMLEPLKKYTEESIETAIENAVDLDFKMRERLHSEFINVNTKENKKDILSRLGVDVEAIDIKTYPFAQIKYAVQSSLGLDHF